MSKLVCWNCGASLDDIPRPISRHANCPQCFNELHCCRLCRHFDRQRNMACFEERADPPLNKENANFCDFFSPARSAFEQKNAIRSSAARNHLDALFAGPDNNPDNNTGNNIDNNTDNSGDKVGADAPADAPVAAQNQPLSKEDLAKKKLDDLFRQPGGKPV